MDNVKLRLSAGKGGDGSRSFARFARVPLGGPDGGDGGKGGDLVLAASASAEDLSWFAGKPEFAAEAGNPGLPGKKYGKNGADLTDRLSLVPVKGFQRCGGRKGARNVLCFRSTDPDSLPCRRAP